MTEKLKTVTEKDVFETFHGCTVDRTYINGELHKVRTIAPDGTFFEVIKHGWNEFKLVVAKEPETKEVWEVSGKYYDIDLDPPRDFDTEQAAVEFKDNCSVGDLKITKVTRVVK